VSELRIEGLHKSFGDAHVLDGLDLVVRQGSLTAVLGPSGCGKTTLLRVVAGFERADAGRVLLGGREVAGPSRHLPPERRGVTVVPQEGALFPHLDVGSNVAFGLPRRHPDRRRRVAEVLALVGLPDLAGRWPAELSGGQQQRVAVARALAPGPEVVLLDEPFSALDTDLRTSVREQVRDVLAAAGATAVLVTHDQEEALGTADQVAVMHQGRFLQVGEPEQVYRHPVDPLVARAVGEAFVLPAVAGGTVATTSLGPVALLPHGAGQPEPAGEVRGQVLVRPEQLRLVPLGEGVTCSVRRVSFHGHDTTVSLVSPDGSDLTCRTQDPVPAGERVGVRVVGEVVFLPMAREGATGRMDAWTTG
jgi:iron(III) transport system ATP-binding protein